MSYRSIIIAGAFLAVISIGALATQFLRKVPTGTGYVAKMLCSAVFNSGRNPDKTLQSDLRHADPGLDAIAAEVDMQKGLVTASLLNTGLFKRFAIHRPGVGCTLASSKTNLATLRTEFRRSTSYQYPIPHAKWPLGNRPGTETVTGVDTNQLTQALDRAFAEPPPAKNSPKRRTQAVVVAYDGKLVAERYADGYSSDTPMLGWSMTKSVLSTLIGIMIDAKNLHPTDSKLIAEWEKDDDPRAKITLDNLLQMASGLEFDETYHPLSDVTEMLFERADMARFAAAKTLAHKPGQHWSYSSGTSLILSRILFEKLQELKIPPLNFAHEYLFHPIGMGSVILEFDGSETFVGSSFMYATARDWARFGQLYLNNGNWYGRKILSRDWVNYVRTPFAKSPQHRYGAHFWNNGDTAAQGDERVWPLLPKDAYAAMGHGDKFVMVIPSRKTVIVRLGDTIDPKTWDLQAFVTDVLAGLPH